MIRYEDAKAAFAQAIYDLLAESDVQEWFSVPEISRKAGLKIGSAFASRVLALSREEDDVFNFFGGDGEPLWTLGKEGFDLIEAQQTVRDASEKLAPASDRVVRFNHNAPDAQEISNQLEEVRESVRGANSPEIDEQERERVFSALAVAKEIWETGHFKLIQLKVGVLLAVEDAAAILAKTAKHVAAAMLVDAIKAFAKNHLQVDLDAI